MSTKTQPVAFDRDKAISKKLKWLTVREFIDKHCPGVTPTTINIALRNGKLDFLQAGRIRLILLTKKTLAWEPQKHSARGKKKTDS